MSEQPKYELKKSDIAATGAERFAWWVFGIGALITVISFVTLMNAMGSYRADASTPALWLSLGFGLMALMLVPALILAGQRQLLEQRTNAGTAPTL